MTHPDPDPLRSALEAARAWIVAATLDEEAMYERGYWLEDELLMKQIDAALASLAQETKP